MEIVNYWKLVVLERYAKFDGRAELGLSSGGTSSPTSSSPPY